MQNLAAYLRMLSTKYSEEYRRIVETIQLVLPFLMILYNVNESEFIELEWFQIRSFNTHQSTLII